MSLVVLVAVRSVAECPVASLELNPTPSTVPPTPWVVLGLQGQLAGEAVERQLVFRNGTQQRSARSRLSEFGANFRQLVVVPEVPLSPGPWTLEAMPASAVQRAADRTVLTRFNAVSQTGRPPVFAAPPAFVGLGTIQSGCGDGLFAEVEARMDQPDAIVEVSLQSAGFGSVVVLSPTLTNRRGPLAGDVSTLRIGADICGGPVAMPAGTTITAKLTPLSRDGVRGESYVVMFSTPARPKDDFAGMSLGDRLFGGPRPR